MAGYLLVPNDKVLETFNAGFSMYVAAWPLLKDYPGSRFQTGLFGYGYLPLPLVESKRTTAGTNVPTGDQKSIADGNATATTCRRRRAANWRSLTPR